MDRDLFTHFPVVLAVARHRSFAAAAAELGMGASAVSHVVKTVEKRVGIAIFARTTRSVALTEAGQSLLAAIGPAFADIEQAIERVGSERGLVSGLLRLNVPRLAIPMALRSVLGELALRHPGLTVEVICDDGLVDIVAGGFDAGIRLGEMIDQDMIAIRLTPPFKVVMVASPQYLAAKGCPDSIADLRRHNCIGFRQMSTGGLFAWDLRDAGHDIAVKVRGSVIVSDAVSSRDFALEGIGIAYLFEPLVRDDIRDGRLICILPEASITEPGLFVYFPRRYVDVPKLSAFIEIVRETSRSASRDG